MNEYIKTRMEEIGLKTQSHINEESLETALMLDDMKTLRFTYDDLGNIIDFFSKVLDPHRLC